MAFQCPTCKKGFYVAAGDYHKVVCCGISLCDVLPDPLSGPMGPCRNYTSQYRPVDEPTVVEEPR